MGEKGWLFLVAKFQLPSSIVRREQQSNGPTFVMMWHERKATRENCRAPVPPPSNLTLKDKQITFKENSYCCFFKNLIEVHSNGLYKPCFPTQT